MGSFSPAIKALIQLRTPSQHSRPCGNGLSAGLKTGEWIASCCSRFSFLLLTLGWDVLITTKREVLLL